MVIDRSFNSGPPLILHAIPWTAVCLLMAMHSIRPPAVALNLICNMQVHPNKLSASIFGFPPTFRNCLEILVLLDVSLIISDLSFPEGCSQQLKLSLKLFTTVNYHCGPEFDELSELECALDPLGGHHHSGLEFRVGCNHR